MKDGLRAALAIAVVTAAVACGSLTQSAEVRAAQMAEQYFEKLASGQPDYGYSLIDPMNQATWQSYEEYAATVSGIDWNRFSVSVVETRYCDDGLCFVCVNVPGGLDSVPSFLRASDNRGNDGIIVKEPLPDDCGNGEVSVFLARSLGEGSGIKISQHP